MRAVLQSITRWELILYLLLLPMVLFAGTWGVVALLAIPLLWLIRRVTTGHFIVPTPFDSTRLLFAVMLLVSLYAMFDPALSIPRVAVIVYSVGLFYACVAYGREHDLGRYHLVALIGLVGAGMGAIGVIGAHWVGPAAVLNSIGSLLPGQLSAIPGAVDGVVNLNELAGLLGWVAPLMVACLVGLGGRLWHENKGALLTLSAVTLFTTALLLATNSRGGIAAFAGALLVMAALRFRWARWLLVVGLISAVVLAIVFDAGSLLAGGEAADQLGLDGRLEIWSRAIYGLQDFPFTGMSVNGFRRVVHILYPLFLISPDIDIAHAHNHLLQAGLDLGLPGLVAYLGLWVGSGLLLWHGLRRPVSAATRTLLIGLAGSLTAGFLFGMLDAIGLGARPSFVWWLLLAALVVAHDQARHETP